MTPRNSVLVTGLKLGCVAALAGFLAGCGEGNNEQARPASDAAIAPPAEVATTPAPEPEAKPEIPRDLNSVVGEFNRQPVENPWHEGTITVRKNGGVTGYDWRNKAGVRWGLSPTGDETVLQTDAKNPYAKSGANKFLLEYQAGKVIGFEFNGEFYLRKGMVRLTQKSGGLKGYINMSVPKPPAGFQFGASFYVAIWPLIEKPMAGFQIGLPSTWIIPSNRDFRRPLVPPTAPAFKWKERERSHFHDVFQTIEGGLGYWVSTRFGYVVPKYRINGTPNGYGHEISTPGWGFGHTKALAPRQMGLAQLSNRLLLPPDGLTFAQVSQGEILGNAWMALPLVPGGTRSKVPTGNQSWTLFLNAANFQGAVAFYIPDVWSRMSRSYPVIKSRGLDARPGEMGSGAMEVNTVPYFEATDAGGVVYSKIPRLQFQVAQDGVTVLMRDITLYSGAALFQSMYRDLYDNGAATTDFNPSGAWKPDCRANPITFKQGGKNVPLTGFDQHVETITFGKNAKNSFGLRWKQARGMGALPEYYRHDGNRRIAVAPTQVPDQTKLRSAEFRPARDTEYYRSPAAKGTVWSKPGPASAKQEVELSDGSTVTYAWYRFIDQPSIMAQGWPASLRDQVQAVVEKLHARWANSPLTMPPPSEGKVATLDGSLVVTAPSGMEHGYVPIVMSQVRK